jgi:potassium-transporting ATPase ATP-binding subunit
MNYSPEVSLHRKFPREAPRIAPRIEAYGAQLWRQSAIESLKKFDPRAQIRNPVMFVVWLGALVTALLTIDPGLFGPSSAPAAYNGVVTVILLLTVWFANFADALVAPVIDHDGNF